MDFVPTHNDLTVIETNKFIVYEDKTSKTKQTGENRKCVYSNVSNYFHIMLNGLKLLYENIF